MTLHIIGLNHRSTPIELREKLAFSAEAITKASTDLLTHTSTNEAVILSTCNRLEIYTHGDSEICIAKWLADQQNIDIKVLSQYAYHHRDVAAIKHLARVASGLDSMVLGEPQIFGQIKEAYKLAKNTGSIGNYLQQLFPAVFSVCKLARSETNIGKNPISIAYTGLKQAEQFTDLKKATVLFIGAGDTIELSASHFVKANCQTMYIANRSRQKAEMISAKTKAKPITIADIPSVLANCDIIVSATASTLPILGKGALETALQTRHHKPMLLLDLAVPRDIEPEAAELEAINLYNIDDLQQLANENLGERQRAAVEAETLIDVEVQKLIRELRVADASDVIKEFRDYVQTIRDEELSDALKSIQSGKDPAVVLATLAHNITNKTLHPPTIKIRQAAYDGHTELISAAKKILVK